MQEQIWVMKRIRRVQQGSPRCTEILPFATKALTLGRIFAVHPPGHRFQVKKLSKRGPDDPITVISKSQAQIDVVVRDRQIDLIQSADFKEYCTPDRDAGAGH